jgi:hypothetical protein
MLRPYSIQNKYIPHTYNLRPPYEQRPLRGRAPQVENLWDIYRFSLKSGVQYLFETFFRYFL